MVALVIARARQKRERARQGRQVRYVQGFRWWTGVRTGVSDRGGDASKRDPSHSDSGLKEDLVSEPRDLHQLQELSVDVDHCGNAAVKPCSVCD